MAYQFVNAGQLDADLTAVANAIREKGGTTDTLAFPAGMVSAIAAISAGTALNFEMVGSTVPPSDPAENTIWVNTDESITGYIFSAEAPASPAEGMVWVTVGASSSAAFNILPQDNVIMLYPMTAKQYIQGTWEDVTAKTYLNGQWADWAVMIISNGSTDYTIAVKDLNGNDRSVVTAEPGYSISYKSSVGDQGYGANGIVYFEEFTTFDLTGISEIVVEATFTAPPQSGNFFRLTVWETLEGATKTNAVRYIDITDGTTRLPVDTISGPHFIGFDVNAISAIILKVSSFYLK